MSATELQQYVQQVQIQMQQLQEQVQRMKQEYEMKMSSGNGPGSSGVLKLSKPPTFNGDRKINAEVWLLELENYFTITNVTNESQRIAFAVSQFRDAAVVWWKYCMLQNKENNLLLVNWEVFKTTLLNNYQPVEKAETARAALHKLKHIGSVAGYCDYFLRLINNVEDMNPADQLFLFKHGLQSNIAREVNIQHPKTLAEAMSFAQRAEIEQVSYARNSSSNSGTNYNRGYRSVNNDRSSAGVNSYNVPSSGSVPMEVSNMQWKDEHQYSGDEYYGDFNEQMHSVNNIQRYSNPPRFNNNVYVPGLTKEQIENYKRTGSCFNCGTPGHMKHQCPKLNVQGNGNAGNVPKNY
jgi:hypothetical protein